MKRKKPVPRGRHAVPGVRSADRLRTPRSGIRVQSLTRADAPLVLDWVLRLLKELGEEGDDLGTLRMDRVRKQWSRDQRRIMTLAARDGNGDMLGVLTLVESFAIYANGHYGIINEMYVAPAARGRGVGRVLLDAARKVGRKRGWTRIDVTAPESRRWARSRRFYEANGFAFTGPKLKCVL